MRPNRAPNSSKDEFGNAIIIVDAIDRVLAKPPYFWNEPKTKKPICPPTHLIFGMEKRTGNIFYGTKHRVRRSCVGGDMAISVFGFFSNIRRFLQGPD